MLIRIDQSQPQCRDSCALITWQFDRVQALAVVIGQSTLNWENPKVCEVVDEALSIEGEDAKTSLDEGSVKLLEFVQAKDVF